VVFVELSIEHTALGSDKVSGLTEANIKILYIYSGLLCQNGYVESFYDRFLRKCFIHALFYMLSEARL
jgi:hypothetical protein